MELTAYHPCPCHAEQKIKFCCGKQIVDDLNRVLALVRGQQSLATLDELDRLIALHGPKDCLVSIKTQQLISMSEIEKARHSNAQFLQANPNHPIGLKYQAMICLAEGNLHGAIQALQDAMDGIKGPAAPVALGSAFRTVGLVLLQLRQLNAGRRHLRFALLLNPQDQEAASALGQSARIGVATQVLKVDPVLPESAGDREWSKPYQQLTKLAARGRWRTALQYLEVKLLPQFPQEPVLLKAKAILELWLALPQKSQETWNALSQVSGIPFDDALDAKMWARALSGQDGSRVLEARTITIPLHSLENALERLGSSKLVKALELGELSEEEGPPPRAVFLYTHRPIEPWSDAVANDDVPRILSEIQVFGRQTDRAPRLQFTMVDDGSGPILNEELARCLGDSADFSQSQSEVTGQLTELQWRMTLEWYLPPELTRAQRLVWLDRQEQYAWLEVMPRVPFDFLDQRSPLDVAGEDRYRLELEALVGNLELDDSIQGLPSSIVQRLRDLLRLSEPTTIAPPASVSAPLTAFQRLRVRWEEASDERLTEEFYACISWALWSEFRGLAQELIRRPSLEGKLPFDTIFRLLALSARDDETALGYLRLGRKHVQAMGQPLGPWLLTELEFRFSRQIEEKTLDLLNEIRTRHMHEPGVEPRLQQLASALHYMSGGRLPAGEEAIAANAPSGGEASSEIWTPLSAASSGSGKLWLPGSQ